MKSKPTTMKEMAKILRVSVSTVSRGLKDDPSIGSTMRGRIRKLARELNYAPNQTAIFLQKGRTQTIGVILPELSEAFFSAAITAIEDAAYKRNYMVLLAQSHDNEMLEKSLVEKMRNHRVDGFLVSVGKNTLSYSHFENLRKHDIPIVFFDRVPAIPNIHYVACDLENGTIEAVEYLLKKGHRTIGLINGPPAIFASKERYEGYIKALLKNRLKFDPSLIVSCDLAEDNVRKAIDNLLNNKRKPTAIVTFNDYVALFAIKYIHELNLKLNEDIEFVSYANLPLINFMENSPAASVEQFAYLQGQKAADILLDLINQKAPELQEQTAYYKVIIESQLIEHAAGQ